MRLIGKSMVNRRPGPTRRHCAEATFAKAGGVQKALEAHDSSVVFDPQADVIPEAPSQMAFAQACMPGEVSDRAGSAIHAIDRGMHGGVESCDRDETFFDQPSQRGHWSIQRAKFGKIVAKFAAAISP